VEILNYNEEKEILIIKYSTHTLWEYSRVDKESYELVKKAKDKERTLKTILRRLLIVGINKKD